MSDFEAILEAYERSGGDPRFLRSSRVASLVVSGNRVLGANEISGIHLHPQQLEDGVDVTLIVDPGVVVEFPVHLCFGVVPREGVQHIRSTFEIGAGARVEFLAHCTFPNAERVVHRMEANIRVGRGAVMGYQETHYHGERGGVETVPVGRIVVEEGGVYRSEFALTAGRVGVLDFDYVVDVGARGVAELTAKVYAYGEDRVSVKETIRLNGEGARGLAKSRIALRERATGEVIGSTEGNAPFCRGHVDCVEIVRDDAVARAVPVVKVTESACVCDA